jgi:hypothetical protein
MKKALDGIAVQRHVEVAQERISLCSDAPSVRLDLLLRLLLGFLLGCHGVTPWFRWSVIVEGARRMARGTLGNAAD